MAKRVLPVAVLLLAGCSLAPPQVRPPLPTPASYPPETGPDGGARAATEIGWRDFFRDPRLQALIADALGVPQVNEDSSPLNQPNWDSLTHLSILVAVDEATQGRAAEISELAQASSVREILDLLARNSLLSD